MTDYKKSNIDTCPGKKAYPSRRLATQHMHMIRSRGSRLRAKGKKIEKLEVYVCTNCNQYHLGHPPRRRLQEY